MGSDGIYSYSEIEFAACGISIAALILLVSSIAYANNNRLMFLLGSIGCFLGHFIPKTGRTSMTFEAAIDWTVSHILIWGFWGAAGGCCIAWALTKKWKLGKQFSIKGLFIVTTLSAFIAVIIKYVL